MARARVMDYETAEHFYKWLEKAVREDLQHETEEAVHRALREIPTLVEEGKSWPEIRDIGERLGGVQANLGWEDEETLPSGITLSGIIHSLSGRAAIVRHDDPVMPWVSRVAQAVFERMKADVDGDADWIQRADSNYNAIVEEAEETAERWRAEGREDLVRRLSLLLKVPL